MQVGNAAAEPGGIAGNHGVEDGDRARYFVVEDAAAPGSQRVVVRYRATAHRERPVVGNAAAQSAHHGVVRAGDERGGAGGYAATGHGQCGAFVDHNPAAAPFVWVRRVTGLSVAVR